MLVNHGRRRDSGEKIAPDIRIGWFYRSQTAYVRERWTALASFNSNLSSSSGTNASTRNSLNVGGRHLLPWNNWFYAGLGAFLQSSEQGIALQSTVGGGIGRYLKNSNRTNIALVLGPAWQNTDYKQAGIPVNNQNVAAAIFYGQGQFFKFSKPFVKSCNQISENELI